MTTPRNATIYNAVDAYTVCSPTAFSSTHGQFIDCSLALHVIFLHVQSPDADELRGARYLRSPPLHPRDPDHSRISPKEENIVCDPGQWGDYPLMLALRDADFEGEVDVMAEYESRNNSLVPCVSDIYAVQMLTFRVQVCSAHEMPQPH